jgi:hypothetical protein
MVIRYTKAGNPYRTPPYSRAEMEEIRRGLNDPPIAIWRHRPARPPQEKEPPALPPAGTRTDRRQP